MAKLQVLYGIKKWTIEEMGLQMFRETVTDGGNVTICGRVFHIQESATGKAQSQPVYLGLTYYWTVELVFRASSFEQI